MLDFGIVFVGEVFYNGKVYCGFMAGAIFEQILDTILAVG
jgi:hypothetical protein